MEGINIPHFLINVYEFTSSGLWLESLPRYRELKKITNEMHNGIINSLIKCCEYEINKTYTSELIDFSNPYVSIFPRYNIIVADHVHGGMYYIASTFRLDDSFFGLDNFKFANEFMIIPTAYATFNLKDGEF